MDMAKEILDLIYVGIGILAAGIPLVITIVKLFKNKTLAENWKTIMAIADAAMDAAEKSGASGADKKQQVIDAVKSGCKSQGIDADAFIDQLEAYIDSTIELFNKMQNK